MLTVAPSPLISLADRLRTLDAGRWADAAGWLRDWGTEADARAAVREHIRCLTRDQAVELVARSRETTTHFAWCLLDEPLDGFSLWLHEYKPQHDWRPGYADSVHNHRYHFATTLLTGHYRHERYRVEIDQATGLVATAALEESAHCGTGACLGLTAEQFHRVPVAADDTMTLLVKSRPVRAWSLSYDPATGSAFRHLPVESRLDHLTNRL